MPAFSPSDPNFESRLRSSAGMQGLLSTLGAELGLVRAGEVHLTAPFDARFSQQDGFLHAGIVTALMDSACGYAAYSLMPADSRVLSVEFKVNLLSPARGQRFRAEGRVVKAGRTLTVCEGKLFSVENDAETLCAIMQATMICLLERNHPSQTRQS
ncbi:MAG TPA: PaaI family thioesterase [Anaerolineales bacterium]|nr:PaaI family thioesterase [Anaerolineales bacterium]